MHSILLLGAAIILLAGALRLVILLLVNRSTETLEFRGPVHAVEITLARGEVTIRGSDDANPRVRRRLRHGLRRPHVQESVDDGVLRLTVMSGIVQYEVDVPRRAAILVSGSNTSATVIGVTGLIELRSSSGTLEGRALSARAVRAMTSAGSIRLSFDTAPDSVEVTATSGSVELTLPDGPYDVETIGDTRCGVPTATGARCRVRAKAPSVRIRPR
jgi:hypothetical protein